MMYESVGNPNKVPCFCRQYNNFHQYQQYSLGMEEEQREKNILQGDGAAGRDKSDALSVESQTRDL